MDSQDIVRRLVVGSQTIDRMKREINSVVSTVLGLVYKKHEIESWHGEFARKYRMEKFLSHEFPGCEWRLIVNEDTPPRKRNILTPVLDPFEVSCNLNTGFGEVEVFNSSYVNFDISHRHVQQVYESLSLFVDGMRKLFPFLEDYWQPFLDAADYAEKNSW